MAARIDFMNTPMFIVSPYAPQTAPKKAKHTSTTSIPPRIKWWKYHDERISFLHHLQTKLTPSIMHSSLPACPDEHWKLLTSEIQSAGKELLGVAKKGKRIEKETWYWTKEVQSAVREKKQGLKKWKAERSEVTRAQYVAAKREAKRTVSIAKAAASQKLYESLDTAEGEKNIYRIARSRAAAAVQVSKMRLVKNDDGRVLRDDNEIRERWRESFAKISNEDHDSNLEEERRELQDLAQNWTNRLSEFGLRVNVAKTEWKDVLNADMKGVNLRPDDAKLRCVWRAASHEADPVPKRD
ncbi:hypothetical protein PRIPAC_94881 [Pristionchus pacificus]|uniref:Uncharacterized protein n=1 Tax=Pristionchus pacificus TaxID=54126 RepID=A0A2A6CHF3_PRIPA|nr:hypothetical protein PRIPAC_94881 [Pristionchus pacificus]|eukprot:PDM77655.1 hypothetical protein PRIPAC_34522 [Pristionchus pacificus]